MQSIKSDCTFRLFYDFESFKSDFSFAFAVRVVALRIFTVIT